MKLKESRKVLGMPVQHEDAYLEGRIHSATPAELIHILYETALDAVRQAAMASASSQLAARTRAISRASSCVMELAGSLNVELGGELGTRLAVLYEYLLHELMEASAGRSEGALQSCEQVLAALHEGWSLAMEKMPPEAGNERDWAQGTASPRGNELFPDGSETGLGDEAMAESGRISWCL